MQSYTDTCSFINKHVAVVRISGGLFFFFFFWTVPSASIVCCVPTSRALISLLIRRCWNCCLAVMNLVQLLVSEVMLLQNVCQGIWLSSCTHFNCKKIIIGAITGATSLYLTDMSSRDLKIWQLLICSRHSLHCMRAKFGHIKILPSTGSYRKPEKSCSHSYTFIF